MAQMGRPRNRPEDVWRHIAKAGPGDCWLWTSSTSTNGYAQFRLNGRMQRGHRVAYELVDDLVPEGLQLDHLCRRTSCCNPAHLEAVTARVNTLRSTGVTARNAAAIECSNGHPFDEANTIHYRGKRQCRTCARKYSREYSARRRALNKTSGNPVGNAA